MAVTAGTWGAKPNHVRPSSSLCSSAKALPSATEGRIWKTLPFFVGSADIFTAESKETPKRLVSRVSDSSPCSGLAGSG